MTSSKFRLPPQSDPPLSPRLTLPTMYDLPSENPESPGLPDEFHIYGKVVIKILSACGCGGSRQQGI